MDNPIRLNNPLLKDNAVIEITTHGGIINESDVYPTKITIPDNMNVIYISAAAPGACNMSNRANMYYIKEFIINKLIHINNKLNLLTHDVTEDTLNQIKRYFANIMKKFRDSDIKRHYNEILKQKTLDPLDEEYMNTFDRNYDITIYKSGQEIWNKVFSRSDDESSNYLDKPFDLDFKINLLISREADTSKGFLDDDDITEDLMIPLSSHVPDPDGTPDHMSTTTLEDLLRLLSSGDIKNVVIFDFTCSVFENNNQRVTDPREIRQLRNWHFRDRPTNTSINTTRKRKFTTNLLLDNKTSGGKRFTKKNRKSRKPFRKSRYRKSFKK